MIPDTQLTRDNIPFVVMQILKDVHTCQNKERQSKRSELYLRCGGGYDTESTTVTDSMGRPLFAFVYHIQICINGSYIYFRDIKLLVPFLKELAAGVKKLREKTKQPRSARQKPRSGSGRSPLWPAFRPRRSRGS